MIKPSCCLSPILSEKLENDWKTNTVTGITNTYILWSFLRGNPCNILKIYQDKLPVVFCWPSNRSQHNLSLMFTLISHTHTHTYIYIYIYIYIYMSVTNLIVFVSGEWDTSYVSKLQWQDLGLQVQSIIIF